MKTHLQKLLEVEDIFFIEGRGVIVTPKIPLSQFHEKNTQLIVLLRRPDGIEFRVLAKFSIPHVQHPKDIGFLCSLPDISKEEVPIGSEIFRIVDSGEKPIATA